MKFLFVHQNFPGQYLHIVRHLVAAKKHDVVFISEPNANRIDGVRLVPYPKPESQRPRQCMSGHAILTRRCGGQTWWRALRRT